ncbi:HEPN domain-containing protein [Rheinheimera fenheensis]|uniref:HEPN domain-containing protein n=1 Tax=Rheinheimera fenheensis TaxID=3152295 RepID=UPI0032615964
MQPVKFLDSAKDILVSFNDEASRRNCISRAYYSAYHTCLIACSSLEIKLPESNSGLHARLINGLRENSQTFYIGTDLADLKKYRTKADYHLGAKISQRDAETVIKLAENLIADVGKLFSSGVETCD